MRKCIKTVRENTVKMVRKSGCKNKLRTEMVSEKLDQSWWGNMGEELGVKNRGK